MLLSTEEQGVEVANLFKIILTLLTQTWGGSPAISPLPFGIDGDTTGEETGTEDPKAEGAYL